MVCDVEIRDEFTKSFIKFVTISMYFSCAVLFVSKSNSKVSAPTPKQQQKLTYYLKNTKTSLETRNIKTKLI